MFGIYLQGNTAEKRKQATNLSQCSFLVLLFGTCSFLPEISVRSESPLFDCSINFFLVRRQVSVWSY